MDELTEPFARLIEQVCPPSAVRHVEQGGDWRPLWSAFAESGFLDALVPEDLGGAGLGLADIAPLIELLGRHAVPLPVGETIIARALLAADGHEAPDGPIALVTGAGPVLGAATADHLLVAREGAAMLVAAQTTPGDAPGLDAALHLTTNPPQGDLRPIAAVLRALLIAGAADRVLEQTAAYANERQQFGKPIGRQQAVQQQLAVLAEHSVSARVAARHGCRSGLNPAPAAVAAAKYCASVAAVEVATIAHAVHGAIGISEEYDLQLLTRRLRAWGLADGSAAYWANVAGRIALQPTSVSALSSAKV